MSFRNCLFSCSLGGVSFREVLIFQKSSFMDCAFCAISETLSPNSKSSRFPLVLSSRSVLTLHFPFRYMPYFGLLFVKCIKTVSGSSFLHVDPVVLVPSITWIVCPLFFFSFNVLLAILILLSFRVNFRISLSISINSLLGFSLELQWIYRSSGKNWHLNSIVSSYPWMWDISPFI